jgi:hypothetical protein
VDAVLRRARSAHGGLERAGEFEPWPVNSRAPSPALSITRFMESKAEADVGSRAAKASGYALHGMLRPDLSFRATTAATDRLAMGLSPAAYEGVIAGSHLMMGTRGGRRPDAMEEDSTH